VEEKHTGLGIRCELNDRNNGVGRGRKEKNMNEGKRVKSEGRKI
jgi:hypothetical protein